MAVLFYYCSILLLSSGMGLCINIDVYGDIGLNVVIKDDRQERAHSLLERKDLDKLQKKMPSNNCTFQYPTDKQVDKLLSYMTNELTKVFVRAGKYIELEKENKRTKIKRFGIVLSKKTTFFEKIFTDMVDNYNNYFNMTRYRVLRNSTCPSEEDVKRVWKDLLYHSHHNLRDSFQRCVAEYLKLEYQDSGTKWEKLDNFVKQESGKIRKKQRNLLCKEFQLCFID